MSKAASDEGEGNGAPAEGCGCDLGKPQGAKLYQASFVLVIGYFSAKVAPKVAYNQSPSYSTIQFKFMNIKRPLLDQTKDPACSASCFNQWLVSVQDKPIHGWVREKQLCLPVAGSSRDPFQHAEKSYTILQRSKLPY